MTSRGVIYMVWGGKAALAAMTSIETLRKVCPEMPVMVLGDHDTAPLENLQVELMHLDLDPFRGAHFLAGRVKPLLYGLSPWDLTLYVDADTKFRQAPDAGWALLKQWDFLVAETGNRSLADQLCGPGEAEYSREMFGVRDLLYHNSGMLFWKRNKRVERLFELWSEEWTRFVGWDEQMALLRALARSEAIFLTLPFSWNTNFPSQAKLLFHDFGQRIAWKFRRRRGRTITANELRLLAREVRETGGGAGAGRRRQMTADELELMASEVRRQAGRTARGGVDVKRTKRRTGSDIRRERLSKPKEAPENKAVVGPERNKAV